ncbi:hypothetical protein [Spirosoma lituiforme]|jgi:hypothetical protein
METNQPSAATQPVPTLTAHERAVSIMKRLLADKRQAEQDIVDNFHTDPLIQAAVARLKESNERRGTPIIKL